MQLACIREFNPGMYDWLAARLCCPSSAPKTISFGRRWNHGQIAVARSSGGTFERTQAVLPKPIFSASSIRPNSVELENPSTPGAFNQEGSRAGKCSPRNIRLFCRMIFEEPCSKDSGFLLLEQTNPFEGQSGRESLSIALNPSVWIYVIMAQMHGFITFRTI